MTSRIPTSKAKTAYGLLSEVRALILAEPKRYHQGIYIDREDEEIDDGYEPEHGYPDCGTIGCVAGWIATLKHREPFNYSETPIIAAKIIGVYDSSFLFYAGALPSNLRPQTREYARAGAKHIAAFQRFNRAQLLAKKV